MFSSIFGMVLDRCFLRFWLIFDAKIKINLNENRGPKDYENKSSLPKEAGNEHEQNLTARTNAAYT